MESRAKFKARSTLIASVIELIWTFKTQHMYSIDAILARQRSWEQSISSELSGLIRDIDREKTWLSDTAIDIQIKSIESRVVNRVLELKNRRFLLELSVGVLLALLFAVMGFIAKSSWLQPTLTHGAGVPWVFFGAAFGTVLFRTLAWRQTPPPERLHSIVQATFSPLWPVFLVPIIIAAGLSCLIALDFVDISISSHRLGEFWHSNDTGSGIALGLFTALSGEQAASFLKRIVPDQIRDHSAVSETRESEQKS